MLDKNKQGFDTSLAGAQAFANTDLNLLISRANGSRVTNSDADEKRSINSTQNKETDLFIVKCCLATKHLFTLHTVAMVMLLEVMNVQLAIASIRSGNVKLITRTNSAPHLHNCD